MITQIKLDYINRVIDESLDEESLELNGKFIGDEGIEALVQTKRVFEVENLDLSRNKLTCEVLTICFIVICLKI